MQLAANARFGLPARLRDATCAGISAPVGATFAWTVLDAIASVQPTSHGTFTTMAEFRGVAAGTTMGRVVLRDEDGAELASRSFPILVDPVAP